jgi:L-galactono-1,4-lactone dehydrogenase
MSQLRLVHDTLLRESQHLRYMWLPYTDKIVVVSCVPYLENDSDHTPTPDLHDHSLYRNQLQPMQALYEELLMCSSNDGTSIYPDAIFDPDFKTWSFTTLRDTLYALDPLNPEHIQRVTASEGNSLSM